MWLGNAVTSSTLHADPPSNETIDVFYIKNLEPMCTGICEVGVETGQGLMSRYLFLANREVFWNSLGPCLLRGRNFASYTRRKATAKWNLLPTFTTMSSRTTSQLLL